MGGFPLAAGWLLISGGCVAFVSVRVCRWLSGADDALLRCLVGLIAAWAQIALVLQILGAAHVLYPLAVVAAHAALAAAAWRLLPAGVRSTWGPATLPAVLTIAACVAFVAYWAAYSGGAPSGEFDTNRYHIVNVAHWFSTHETWSLPFAQPSDHTAVEPGNGELLSLWLMLPFGDDRFAYATNIGAFVLVILAASVLARELGGRAWTGAVASLAVLSSPLVTTAFPHSMLTDLWGLAGVAAVPALGLAAARVASTRLWCLAGVAAGLAAGTKFVDVLPAVGLLVLAVLATRPGSRVVGAAALGMVAACAFWYLRNAVATGNPVYPQSLRLGSWTVLGGDDSPVAESRVSLLGQLTAGHRGVLGSLRDSMSTTALPVVLLCVAAVAAVALRRLRPHIPGLGLATAVPRWLLGGVAVCAAGYLVTPYSGGGDPPTNLYMNAGLRFLLPAMLLAAVCAALVLPPAAMVAVTVGAFAARAGLVMQGSGDRPDLAFRWWAVAVAVGAAGTAIVMCRMAAHRPDRLDVRSRSVVGAGLVAAVLAACAVVSSAPAGVLAVGTVAQPAGSPPSGCMCALLVNVPDVRAVLAPTFTAAIRSVGLGDTEGARREILDPAALGSAIDELRPGLVIVGDDQSAMPLAPWTPPAAWRIVARGAGAVAYVPGT